MGKVCHEEIDENGRLKMNVIKGKQISHIEVVLKHGDKQVPASHHLASVRVELVVLDANYHIEESTYWPCKEFKDHFMPVSKNSTTRMTVERGKFNLDGGRKVYTVASIKESSWKQKVRLGVMVIDRVEERVLEGVSSNEFYVIHERRRDATCGNKESKRLVLQKDVHSPSLAFFFFFNRECTLVQAFVVLKKDTLIFIGVYIYIYILTHIY